VHDLHPDYASTRYAVARARAGVELVAVQHHLAHFASCLAESGHRGRAIGVTFDGAGLGLDGAIWGGELWVGDCASAERVGQLAYTPQPGGEQAVREPWRMALAHAWAAGLDFSKLASWVGERPVAQVEQLLGRQIASPRTSSVGRLFDAVAVWLGGPQRVSYEGQAAAWLEAQASSVEPCGEYPLELTGLTLDPRPLFRAIDEELLRRVPVAEIAHRFHSTLSAAIAAWCLRVRERTELETVALSGGVFVNALLASETALRLRSYGFEVLTHRWVPPNDGGLSLGQLAVAAARDAREKGD
jgi:hydrogenase maturation protein HypF